MKDMSNWKDGDEFRVVSKKLDKDGKSVSVEKKFRLMVVEERSGPY